MPIQLRANRPLKNAEYYGYVREGDVFEAPDSIARSLMRRGLAEKYYPPVLEPKAITQYSVKAFLPQEHKRGRPPKPTPCRVCGVMCPSAREARLHCRGGSE